MSGEGGASRRAFLGASGAALAVAGTVALVGCGASAAPSSQPVAPPGDVAARDLAALGQALELERRTIWGYVAGIPLLGRRLRQAARQFLSEELEHTGELIALIKAVGGTAPGRANSYSVGAASDVAGVLQLLHLLEAEQVAGYLRAIPLLSPGPVRASVATILNVDAQHVSLLRLELGQDPVPSAFVTGAE